MLTGMQVDLDRRTVWVFGPDGSTIGRFSTRYGMDVHTTFTEQRNGAGECLHCTHTKPTRADWNTFIQLMKEHYGVDVDEDTIDTTQLLD